MFETIGAEFVINHFDWSSEKTGSSFSLCGIIGVVCLFSFHFLTSCLHDFELLIIGMILMLISCILLYTSLWNRVSEFQFYASLALMYSVGYPIAQSALLGMFSKIVKTGPQGAVLGWFGSAGSLARILFPLLTGFMAEITNDGDIFGLTSLVLIVSVSVLFSCRHVIYRVIYDTA